MKNIFDTTGFKILSRLGYSLADDSHSEFALFYSSDCSCYIEFDFEDKTFGKFGFAEGEGYFIILEEAHAIYFIFNEMGFDDFNV